LFYGTGFALGVDPHGHAPVTPHAVLTLAS
jgi:hypothetical protein